VGELGQRRSEEGVEAETKVEAETEVGATKVGR
jgi:hypothetical protein